MWWSSARNYKNGAFNDALSSTYPDRDLLLAITNELFLFTSAALYLRTKQAGLLSNAKLVCVLSFHIEGCYLLLLTYRSGRGVRFSLALDMPMNDWIFGLFSECVGHA